MAKKRKDDTIIINASLLAALEAAPSNDRGAVAFTAEQDQVLEKFYIKIKYKDLKKLWEEHFGPCPSPPTLLKRYKLLTGKQRTRGRISV